MKCHSRGLFAMIVCLLVSLFLTVPAAQQQPPPARDASAAFADAVVAPEFKAFHAQVLRYLELQRRLRAEVSGPVPGSTAADVVSRSDALAAAIQRARQEARPGDFFDAECARAIKARVATLVRDPAFRLVLNSIDDEPPSLRTPRVHMRFPASNQMATMPPSLLKVLPPLPAQLEYRIVNQYLVLRDTEASLILDVIGQAVRR